MSEQNSSIAAMPFIYSNGAPQSDGTRKLVRAHVAKQFHAKRQTRQKEKQTRKNIAPNTQRAANPTSFSLSQCSVLNFDPKEGELQAQGSQNGTISAMEGSELSCPVLCMDGIGSGNGLMPARTGGQDHQVADDDIDTKIEPAAVIGLLRSGASREKNLRIGWLQGVNSKVTQTPSKISASHATNQTSLRAESFVSKEKSLESFISPCPEVLARIYRNLGAPNKVDASPQAQRLVERYATKVDVGATVRGLRPSTLPLRNSYMPAARSHDALWFASVAFASVMDRILQNRPLDSVSLRYKGETIRAITSNLNERPCEITDETIAAVQALATIECICGNVEAFGLHLGAMKEMVRLRGGLETLGFNGLLSSLIQMHEWRWDLIADNVEEDIKYSSPKEQPQPALPTDLLIFTLGASVRRTSRRSKGILSLLSHLENLAHAWDIQASFSSVSAAYSFKSGCQDLLDESFVLEHPEEPDYYWTTEDYEFESLCLSFLMFSSNDTDIDKACLDKRRLQSQELQRLLKHTDLAGYWEDLPGALIWCLAVGVAKSKDCAEYSWFMAHLTPMLMMLAMECWNDLQRSLQIVGWLLRCSQRSMVCPRW